MNKQTAALSLILSLIIGVSGGYLLGYRVAETASNKRAPAESSHEHSTASMAAHPMFVVDSENAPTVQLSATEDTKSGWNVSLNTENFRFTPENAGSENIVGEGHAHLYVDGEKIARLYGTNFHYDGNFDGTKTFRVTLNANDHSEYAVDGQVIEASQQVTHEEH